MEVASHFSHKNCHFCPFSLYEISIHLKAFLKMVIYILTIFKVFTNPTRGLPPGPFRVFSPISSEVPEY